MKHFFKYLVANMLLILFFIDTSFAQVGSTGHPNTDWERDYVCWSNNGTDSTLTRFTLFIEGENNGAPAAIKYFNANNQEVSITGGNIALGFCGNPVVVDSFDYELFPIEMCDFVALGPTYNPFIRLFFVQKNTVGATLGTINIGDYDYQGNPYTVQGSEGIGLCADIDTARLVFMERLCDVETRDVTVSYNSSHIGGGVFELSTATSPSDYIGVTNFTIDCGQGEVFSGLTVVGCKCDYRNVPDGLYDLNFVIDFWNDGTAIHRANIIRVKDGVAYYESLEDINIDKLLSTPTYTINFTTTPFFRQFFENGTVKDVDLNNNPYTLSGTVAENCENKSYLEQHYEPSTRPNMPIVGDECYERTVSTNANNYKIGFPTVNNGVSSIQFNGSAIPLNYPYIIFGQYQEEQLVSDIQNYLVGQSLDFASVYIEKDTLYFSGLDNSITSIIVNTGSSILNGISESYTGDSTLFYSVFRYVDSGNPAMVIDHEGKETTLPRDAIRVRCGGGSGEDNTTCQVKGEQTVRTITSGQFVFNANEYHSIDIAPLTAGVIVTTGSDAPVTYPSSYANRMTAPECEFLTKSITVDASAPGASVLLTYIK